MVAQIVQLAKPDFLIILLSLSLTTRDFFLLTEALFKLLALTPTSFAVAFLLLEAGVQKLVHTMARYFMLTRAKSSESALIWLGVAAQSQNEAVSLSSPGLIRIKLYF